MPQKVDPFIPVDPQQSHKRPAKPVIGVGNDIIMRPRIPRKQNLDQLRPWYNVQKPQAAPSPVVSQPAHPQPQPRAEPRPMPVEEPQQELNQGRTSRLQPILRMGKYALLSIGILAAGLLLQIALIGEVLIAAYAVFVIIKRLESRTSFILALVSFVYIMLLLFVRPDPNLMKNFAMYAFLFLAIGAVSLLREARY